jgi:hypothetical protein
MTTKVGWIGAGMRRKGLRPVHAMNANRAVDIDLVEENLDGMTKIQIQVPEELFREIRAFARKREWSLAETFRRGAELLLQVYPEPPTEARERWMPPTSGRVGWKGLTSEQLREAAFADGDPRPE